MNKRKETFQFIHPVNNAFPSGYIAYTSKPHTYIKKNK